jgi:aspartyl protease family protein
MLKQLVCIILLASTTLCEAANVGLVGMFPGKALLVVDGAPPKIVAVGSEVADGIKLVSIGDGSAIIDIHGKRQTLKMGEYVQRSADSAKASVTLHRDISGHFLANGQINGHEAKMLVDTGASYIAMPASDATRMNLNYRNGAVGAVSTANGVVPAYKIKLDTVKIGDIEVHQVDALVQESGLPVILLGMSFLNRMEIRQEGDSMTMNKRY